MDLDGPMPPVALDAPDLTTLKEWANRLGYTFVVSEDGTEERMLRPDGSLALIARRAAKDPEAQRRPPRL